jgi:hypothetical protein
MTASFAALTSGVSEDNVREDFTAFAIDLNPVPTTARIDIRIERWSTDEEREQLRNLVLENYSHLPARLNRSRPRRR